MWPRRTGGWGSAASGGFSIGTGLALKKTVHAAEQDRPDVAVRRRQWRADQPFLDPARLVFIDETATATNMARRRGRCRRGRRLVGKVPHGHWMTTTFVAGLRATGLTAPFVIAGAMSGAAEDTEEDMEKDM